MKWVLFVGIIATIFVFGGALQCYHSLERSNSFNTSTPTISCTEKSDKCIKVSTGLATESTLVIRSCIQNSSYFLPDMHKFVENQTITYVYQDYCDTDKCNSAQSIFAIVSTIFTSLFVSIFASY